MEKSSICKTWIWGLVLMIAGGILIPSSALALLAHLDNVTPGNWNNLVPDDYSRAMATLILLGRISAGAGIITQLVAWIGAVLNTHRLTDRRWWNALLWSGIAGMVTTPLFGLGALVAGSVMIAYLVGGPDGMAAQVQQPQTAPPKTLAPTI